MSSLRVRLSALVLVASVATVAAGPAFARATHRVCGAKAHDCGKTPAIAACCCGDHDSSAHGAPIQSRVELRPDLLLTAAVMNGVLVAATPHVQLSVHLSPPRSDPPHFELLFAQLLI